MKILEIPSDEQGFVRWLETAPAEDVEAYLQAEGFDVAKIRRQAQQLRAAFTAILTGRMAKA